MFDVNLCKRDSIEQNFSIEALIVICITSIFKIRQLKNTLDYLFEHLYVEISSMSSFSAFGYTNRTEIGKSEMNTEYKANWKLTIALNFF